MLQIIKFKMANIIIQSITHDIAIRFENCQVKMVLLILIPTA